VDGDEALEVSGGFEPPYSATYVDEAGTRVTSRDVV
jgi:hypothetical protein